jgi:LAS superfamily LD-carboxypeptidase LdcB
MKKLLLAYTLAMLSLLTACGNKTINDDLDSAEVDTTTESVVNNETMATTTQPRVVTKLQSDNTQIEVTVGETLQLECTLLPSDTPTEYSTIEWYSTDDTIATVDDTGLITGIQNGMCTVVATSTNNPEAVVKFGITVSGGSNVVQVVQASTISVPTSQFTVTTKATTSTTKVTQTQTQTQAQAQTQEPIDDTPEEVVVDEQPIDIILTAPEVTTEVQPTYINSVLLVNSSHPLPESYAPSSENVSGEYGLLSEVQQAFDTMSADAMNSGVSLTIHSGYVSYAEQNVFYQNAVSSFGQDYANQYVDMAGYSESQTGLSIMLNSANSDFDNTPEAIWVAENCYKYGFIVRYPQGKEGYTNKSYRSYQIRYVGVSVATEMYNQNLCLEEYLS